MSRARGANAQMAIAFEDAYGVPPNNGFFKVPFVSSQIGDQQDLVASNLLGQGRDPARPSLDVINNTGDIVVPVDLRNFGLWLKAMFGPPTTTQGVAAKGNFVFSGQPAATSFIAIGGANLTFVAADPAVDQAVIGATLADTLANAVIALNQSPTAALAANRYSLSLDGTTINIVSRAVGVDGNAVTLSVSEDADAKAVASGATMTGGSAVGPYHHVFTSGAPALPSMANEVGNPDMPSFAMNYGVMVDKIAIQLQRSGLLDATVSVIAQGEKPRTPASTAGAATELAVERFAQFSGKILRSGASLGDVVSGNFTVANNLDTVEVIRDDGRIAGADPGEAAHTGQAVTRFKDTVLFDLATNGTPVDLTYGWRIADGKELSFEFHEVYLPRPKAPITGPGGIQVTYDWQAAKNAAAGRAVTVTLVNDVEAY